MNDTIPRDTNEEFHDYSQEHEPTQLIVDIDDIIHDRPGECAPLLPSGLQAIGTPTRTNAPPTNTFTPPNAAMTPQFSFDYVESESSLASPEIDDSDVDDGSIQLDPPVHRGRTSTIVVEIPAYDPSPAFPSPIPPTKKRTASLTRDSNGRFVPKNGERSKKRSKSSRPTDSIPAMRSRQAISQERDHHGRFAAKSTSPSRMAKPWPWRSTSVLQGDLKFLARTSWGTSLSQEPSENDSDSVIRPPVTRNSRGKSAVKSSSSETQHPVPSSTPEKTPIRPPLPRNSSSRVTSESSSSETRQPVPSNPVETPIRPPLPRNSSSSSAVQQPVPAKPKQSVIKPPPPKYLNLKPPADSPSLAASEAVPSKPSDSVIRPPPRKNSTGKTAPVASTSATKQNIAPGSTSQEVRASESRPIVEVALKPEKRKRQPVKSPFFATPTKGQMSKASKDNQPPTPNAGEDGIPSTQASPKKRTLAKTVSCIPFPPLSAPNFGLIQEKLAHDPFRLLIAVTFLIRTHGKHAIPIFFELMEKYPTPEALANTNKEDVVSIIRHLGLQNQRADTYKLYAKIWLDEPPTKGKRYPVRGYPDPDSGRNCQLAEVLSDSDERHAWEIGHMTNGPYALDSWRIFCRDRLRGVAESWNGEGSTQEGFQPEWMRVVPEDKELKAYLRWMWLKEGFEWDPFTGDREVANPELMKAAIEGRIAWDDAGGMRILGVGEAAGGVASQVKGLRDMEGE